MMNFESELYKTHTF